MASGSDYQRGTTAAPQTARRVIAAISPQVKGLPSPYASFSTTFGSNKDLTFTAKDAGAEGSQASIRYVVAGVSTPLSVTVSGRAVTVNVATDGASAATSTANQVLAAVNASPAASAVLTAALATGSSGVGVVAALSATNLAGGADIQGGISNAPTPTIPPIHYTYGQR